jgi:hypothetical protein
MKKSGQGYLEDARVHRVADNLAEYLGDLLKIMSDFMERSEPLRSRILADVKPMVEQLPERERGVVLSAIAFETQQVFNAAGSPKVGTSRGCVGAEGGGITVTEGNVSVTGCVIGSLASGPQGGGAEVSVKY